MQSIEKKEQSKLWVRSCRAPFEFWSNILFSTTGCLDLTVVEPKLFCGIRSGMPGGRKPRKHAYDYNTREGLGINEISYTTVDFVPHAAAEEKAARKTLRLLCNFFLPLSKNLCFWKTCFYSHGSHGGCQLTRATVVLVTFFDLDSYLGPAWSPASGSLKSLRR